MVVYIENSPTKKSVNIESSAINKKVVVSSVSENKIVIQSSTTENHSISVTRKEAKNVYVQRDGGSGDLNISNPTVNGSILTGDIDGSLYWTQKYQHPSYAQISHDPIGDNIVSALNVDNKGHVTKATLKSFSDAGIARITDLHSHSNKALLDNITSSGSGSIISSSERTKLQGIEAGAQVNIQSDWNQTDDTQKDFIKNKPTDLSSFNNDVGYITGYINNYVSDVSGSGNGTLTLTRSGLSDLTVDLYHSHFWNSVSSGISYGNGKVFIGDNITDSNAYASLVIQNNDISEIKLQSDNNSTKWTIGTGCTEGTANGSEFYIHQIQNADPALRIATDNTIMVEYDLYVSGNQVATQTWVQDQGYITDYTVSNSDLTGLNISELNNDSGYITDYTVTNSDLTGLNISELTNDADYIKFNTETWITSTEGANRFYFSDSGGTIIRGAGLYLRNSGNYTVVNITDDQKVGIGTDNPLNALHVAGHARLVGGKMMFQSDQDSYSYGQIMLQGESNTDYRFSIGYNVSSDYAFLHAYENGVGVKDIAISPSGGNVAIGKTSASVALDVSGDFQASGHLRSSASDERLKTDLQGIEGALHKVRMLKGYTFSWNEKAKELNNSFSEERETGLIAQQVQKVLPEAVSLAPFDAGKNGKSKTGANYKTVNEEKLVPLLIEAINELQNKVEMLERRQYGSSH